MLCEERCVMRAIQACYPGTLCEERCAMRAESGALCQERCAMRAESGALGQAPGAHWSRRTTCLGYHGHDVP